MYASSPGSARRGAERVGVDRRASSSAYRSRTATSSARSPAAATGWPRSHSYGTSQSHDGSLPSATCAFTAIVTPAPDRSRDVTEHLGPARRVLRQEHRRVPPVAEGHGHEPPGDGRHARHGLRGDGGVDAEVRRRGDERERGVLPVPRAGERERERDAHDRRARASSPSRRCAVSGWANPHAGQSNRSAVHVSSAPQLGHVAASWRHAEPERDPRDLAPGVAAQTTCGSEAFATIASSGCASATARHASPTACTSP